MVQQVQHLKKKKIMMETKGNKRDSFTFFC